MAGRRFVSEDLEPLAGSFEPQTMARGEPSLPAEFRWGDQWLAVARVVKTWRTSKVDRGDAYLKRHYFEFDTSDGRRAVVYFERQARRGDARWRLFTIEAAPTPS